MKRMLGLKESPQKNDERPLRSVTTDQVPAVQVSHLYMDALSNAKVRLLLSG